VYLAIPCLEGQLHTMTIHQKASYAKGKVSYPFQPHQTECESQVSEK
jgi:hypothetical protein